MSKFLTVPIWYDKNGRLNQMLTGDARSAIGPENISIGVNSSAGVDNGFGGSVVIGHNSHGNGNYTTVIGYQLTGGGDNAIAIGSSATANKNSIAIGTGIMVEEGGIGIGGNANANQIQLGGESTKYDLTVGDGNGTAKIGTLVLGDAVLPNNISSAGLYLCTARTTVAGITSWVSGLIWINNWLVNAYTVNGSVSFNYSGSNHTITCEGAGATLEKCFKIFQN